MKNRLHGSHGEKMRFFDVLEKLLEYIEGPTIDPCYVCVEYILQSQKRKDASAREPFSCLQELQALLVNDVSERLTARAR